MKFASPLALGVALQFAAVAQSTYTVQWTRGYGDSRYFCLPESAVVAADGDIWMICPGHDYAADKQLVNLYRIDGKSGDLKLASALRTGLRIPEFTFEWSHRLVITGSSIGVLTDTFTGGQRGSFEGVFFTPLDPRGAVVAVPVIPKGSQLQEVRPTNDGNTLATADQEPFSIRKLDPYGKLLWQRIFSSKVVLPTMAVFPDDSICVSAQVFSRAAARSTLKIIRLNSLGQVTKQIPIPIAQAAVAAGPDGSCVLLYNSTFDSHALRLTSFDSAGHRHWDKQAPVEGKGGRSYTIDAFGNGFLATGLRGGKPVLARLSQNGQSISVDPLPEGFQKLTLGAGGAYAISVGGESHNESFRVYKIKFN